MDQNLVILVDKEDKPMGTMEKMEAHRKAMLHRAVSVFIVNSKNQWLLQKRALDKYHSPGLWTNTACTHPFDGESNLEAANRRLHEEMGLSANLTEIFHFIYHEQLDHELSEHELDHVFIGLCDELPMPNPEEVAGYRYVDFAELHDDIQKSPDGYTVWFRKVFEKVNSILNER